MGWFVSRRSIPMFMSSVFAVAFANLVSRMPRGFHHFLGSFPRKKFRHTDINGTVARSWNTVAIPFAIASRGELNSVFCPEIRNSPSLCL